MASIQHRKQQQQQEEEGKEEERVKPMPLRRRIAPTPLILSLYSCVENESDD